MKNWRRIWLFFIVIACVLSIVMLVIARRSYAGEILEFPTGFIGLGVGLTGFGLCYLLARKNFCTFLLERQIVFIFVGLLFIFLINPYYVGYVQEKGHLIVVANQGAAPKVVTERLTWAEKVFPPRGIRYVDFSEAITKKEYGSVCINYLPKLDCPQGRAVINEYLATGDIWSILLYPDTLGSYQFQAMDSIHQYTAPARLLEAIDNYAQEANSGDCAKFPLSIEINDSD